MCEKPTTPTTKIPRNALSTSCMKRDCEETEAPRETEAEFISCPFALHPRASKSVPCRRQVSWLADQRPSPPSRRKNPQWLGEDYRTQLRGQPRHWATSQPSPHSLLVPNGTDDMHDYRLKRSHP